MRAVVQRVARASVRVEADLVSEIRGGVLVFLGVTHGDSVETAGRLAAKVSALRLFEDTDGRMNLCLADVGGEVLCVSQFTLYGDLRRGNRPSFTAAAPPGIAAPLYERFCLAIEGAGLACRRGVFGAHMEVELVNDGPVTLILDTAEFDRPRRA
ncbi:MAG: D-aminoacyl-tRNA deacylase [Dehalococcoidia bacterium]